ncbi:hypothetical protein SPBR_03306 [Sporothrix brasiliensis 5110]|uniref:Uncharacterized protein n=1 Tax=Sporothrix brasiliensis 5110 TaxID=1398154 RepID=A0A0C2J7Y6_9PEZI|nr:uncharacterized protein SPBR_03306 [Sporothrix brasiliensis 5110]KIH93112.1 hypothetical protein SPBR_03306 [Sporothrix brasiliensis 5110]
MLPRVSSMVATAGSRASRTSSSSSVHTRSSSPFATQAWFYESFLAHTDQYERLVATGSPRVGVSALASVSSVLGLVNGVPNGMANGMANGCVAVPSYPTHIEFELPDAATGAAVIGGVAPGLADVNHKKVHTWPLSKKELKMWQA